MDTQDITVTVPSDIDANEITNVVQSYVLNWLRQQAETQIQDIIQPQIDELRQANDARVSSLFFIEKGLK